MLGKLDKFNARESQGPYLLIHFPATRAPMALPNDAGMI